MDRTRSRTKSKMSPFDQGVSQFSSKFVQAVSSSVQNKEDNMICSPLSCLISLAMAQAGAKGRTLENMTKALCLPKNLTETRKGVANLVSKLKLLQADEKEESDSSRDDDEGEEDDDEGEKDDDEGEKDDDEGEEDDDEGEKDDDEGEKDDDEGEEDDDEGEEDDDEGEEDYDEGENDDDEGENDDDEGEEDHDGEDVDLILSNRVYLADKNLQINKDFLTTLGKTFKASALAVDFLDSATVDSINEWVETETKNKIKNICNSESFDENTCVVLINTIYFKCDWMQRFIKSSTKPKTFYLNATKTVEVPFMLQENYFPFANLPELDAKLLELPYRHTDFSFVIILPNKKTGLAALERKMATLDFAQLLQKKRDVKVDVSLPKFEFETTLNIHDNLKKMGMKNAFDAGSADFTGISNDKPLFISKVIQKAFIEVNEEGTVAGAATMQCQPAGASAFKEQIYEFNCDHPFAFFVVYKGKYTLFAGSLKSPPQDSEPPKKKYRL